MNKKQHHLRASKDVKESGNLRNDDEWDDDDDTEDDDDDEDFEGHVNGGGLLLVDRKTLKFDKTPT